MADYTGNLYDTGGGVFNVKAFGATGNGTTDDTAAIQSACTALQSAGGGTLLFPPGSYRIFSAASYPTVTATTSLVLFSGLSGVRIEGFGATLVTTRTMTIKQSFRVFEFAGCTNVTVEGLRGTGHTVSGSDNVEQGAHFVVLWGACRNVRVQATLTGFYSGLMVIAGPHDSGKQDDYATDDTQRSRGIDIDLDVTNCGYGANFQFSGDAVEGRVVSRGGYRSYFPYGVRDHRVSVDSADHIGADVLLNSYGGRGLENVHLVYSNTQTSSYIAAQNSNAGVEITFGDTKPATFRGIHVTYDVRYKDTNTFGPAIRVTRHDDLGGVDTSTVTRGHKLHELTLSGRIEGPGNPFDFLAAGSNLQMEEYRAFELADLEVVGTTAPVLDLRALKDQVTFRNVVSDGALVPTVSAPIRIVKQAVVEAGVQQRSPSDGLGSAYVRAATVLTGDLTTARNVFRVKLPGSGAFFRLRFFSVFDWADFSTSRIESEGVRSWSATLNTSGQWGIQLPITAETGDRTKGAASGFPTVSLVDGDANGGYIAASVSGFNVSGSHLALVLEAIALSPVEVQVL